MQQPHDQQALPDDDYDQLPEPIKVSMTRKEYLWLSDEQKAHLIEQECDPEW